MDYSSLSPPQDYSMCLNSTKGSPKLDHRMFLRNIFLGHNFALKTQEHDSILPSI